MSDYLTNLVARGFGRAPVLQPRLPSLFEPPSPAPEATAEDPPRAPRQPQPAAAHSAAAPVEPAHRLHPPTPSLVPPPVPVPVPLPVPGNRTTSQPGPTGSAPVQPSGGRTLPAPDRDQPAAAPAENRVPSQQAAAVPALRPIQEPAPPRPEPTPGPPPPPTLSATVIVRPQTVAAAAPVSPVQPPAANAPREAEPSPIIQVRIGRVEVRAVLPPTPPVRRAAEPLKPALSLEEYLKQRSGRRP